MAMVSMGAGPLTSKRRVLQKGHPQEETMAAKVDCMTCRKRPRKKTGK